MIDLSSDLVAFAPENAQKTYLLLELYSALCYCTRKERRWRIVYFEEIWHITQCILRLKHSYHLDLSHDCEHADCSHLVSCHHNSLLQSHHIHCLYLNSVEAKYLCQVFYQKLGTDKWKIIFTFFPKKKHIDVSLMWYKA